MYDVRPWDDPKPRALHSAHTGTACRPMATAGAPHEKQKVFNTVGAYRVRPTQWRKWRAPVNTMVSLDSLAVATTASSRIDPPG